MSRPVPIASPLAGRATGVVVRPMKPVMSADAGAAVSNRSATTERRRGVVRLAVRMSHGTPTSHLRTPGSIPDNLHLMDFRPSDEQVILRRTVRDFAEAEMRPHVMEWDEAQQFSADLLPKLAGLGLLCIQFAQQYAGPPTSALHYFIFILK